MRKLSLAHHVFCFFPWQPLQLFQIWPCDPEGPEDGGFGLRDTKVFGYGTVHGGRYQ